MIFEEVSETLPRKLKTGSRMVKAIHSAREIEKDPQFELDMSVHLQVKLSRDMEKMKATGRS